MRCAAAINKPLSVCLFWLAANGLSASHVNRADIRILILLVRSTSIPTRSYPPPWKFTSTLSSGGLTFKICRS